MNEIGAMEQEAIEKLLDGGWSAVGYEVRLDDVKQIQFGELVVYTVLSPSGLPHLPNAEQRVAFFHRGRKRWDMIAN